MDFIVGGRAQGKTDYALKKYGLREDEICDGALCSPQEAENSRMVNHLHELIRRFPEWTPSFRADAVILCDEIGGGIVPADAEERDFRDRVGRIGCRIAAEADSVTRIVFGIPAKLK